MDAEDLGGRCGKGRPLDHVDQADILPDVLTWRITKMQPEGKGTKQCRGQCLVRTSVRMTPKVISS
jgi:hypothetical protein